MAKFYFDLEVLGLIQASAKAEEFPDLPRAIYAAKRCNMLMVAEEIARGECPGHGSLLVRDEAGRSADTVRNRMSGVPLGLGHRSSRRSAARSRLIVPHPWSAAASWRSMHPCPLP
jgi:hypothetical protein